MSSFLPNRYPLDLTGVGRDNYVSSELVTLSEGELRTGVPMYSPFYKKGLVITDNLTDTELSKDQYRLMNLVPLPSAMAASGSEIYSIIVVTDLSVSQTLSVSYQTLGGDYVRNYNTVANLITVLLADTRKRDSSWPNILSKDTAFDPALHFHAVGDAVGWEYVASALEEVKVAILLGDEVRMLKAFDYIDTHREATLNKIAGEATALTTHIEDLNNPHGVTKAQVGLGKVENFPLASAAVATEGLSNEHYLTPETAMQAMAGRIATDINSHEAATDNPHMTTKAQVGLGKVENYATATNEQALAGSNTNLYVTPANIKAVVDNIAQTLIPKDWTGRANGVAPLNDAMQVDEVYLENLVVSGAPAVYDFQMYTAGKPTSRQVLLQVCALRAFTCAMGFSGSVARCDAGAAQNATCEITKNGAVIGTLTFPSGSNYGSFNVSVATSFAAGDILSVKAPAAPDTSLAGITLAVFGTLKTA